MLAEYTREELAAGLDRVVGELLEESGVAGPPVNAAEIARALGIVVAVDDRQEGRARYVRLGGRLGPSRATILLWPDPRPERRQWAVAHEIGEHAAHRVFAVWGVDPRETVPGAREHVANQLAGRLLLPTRWFEPDAATCGWDLAALKARYDTASHELIARRMLECRPAVVVTIFDQQRISFRRSNVPGRAPAASRMEMECWRRVHERCRACQVRQGVNVVQGWPVHEDQWKREILRMAVEQWEG
jgi:hypothetical protein